MKLRELWGIPIPGTEKAVGLKKVTKDFMGKVRTYYEPVGNKINEKKKKGDLYTDCLLYTSPSPRDLSTSRMPSSA